MILREMNFDPATGDAIEAPPFGGLDAVLERRSVLTDRLVATLRGRYNMPDAVGIVASYIPLGDLQVVVEAQEGKL